MTYVASLRCSVVPHHATPGVCRHCGKPLLGRQTAWCSRQHELVYRQNHMWSEARKAAKRRDGGCVRPGCPTSQDRLQVNHIVPRNGAGYGWDCAHHLDGLETLCHHHHLDVTNQQGAARRAAMSS